MAPEYLRKGSSDYVYIYPDDSAIYTYMEAQEYCSYNYTGATLPSIHSKYEAQNMGVYGAEQNGELQGIFVSTCFIILF